MCSSRTHKKNCEYTSPENDSVHMLVSSGSLLSIMHKQAIVSWTETLTTMCMLLWRERAEVQTQGR